MQKTCLEKIRKELQLSNCGFNYTKPEKFARSQWQQQSKNVFYLLWRIILAVFFLAAVIHSMASSPGAEFRYYFIYLTNWGILLCMIVSVYGAILVTYWYFHPTYADKISESDDMPLGFKLYWSIHNTTLILSIVITIIYWSILHKATTPVSATNVMTHACNSVLMFIDMLIMAYPLRLYHVIQTILLGLIYVVFTVIYYAAGGTDKCGNLYIYNVLDWSSSDFNKNGVTVVGTLLLSMAIHIILFGVFRLRVFIHTKCVRCNKEAILPITTTTPNSKISMVLGSYEYNNNGFSTSTEKI